MVMNTNESCCNIIYVKCVTVGRASDLYFISQSKAPVVSMGKTFYPQYSVLVGSKNRFERDLHMQN